MHYRIPVGQFYTGTFPYLVLAADDDAATAVDVHYRNVRVYEEGQSSQRVTHPYDPLNQLLTRTADPDGDTGK